jgi:DNA mismatch repair protein MutS
MLRQYLQAKSEHPDCVLFFRMGDFYEVFFEDAHICHDVLGWTVTSRNKDQGDSMPMAGTPHHSSETPIRELVKAGYRVAICEQLESPQATKGIVRRGVVRVITPGMLMDEGALDAKSNLFLAGVATSSASKGASFGVSSMDVSTGEWRLQEAQDLVGLLSELRRLRPAEVVAPESQRALLQPVLDELDVPVTWRVLDTLDLGRMVSSFGERRLETTDDGVQVASLSPSEVRERWKVSQEFLFHDRASVEAAAACMLEYLAAMQGGVPLQTGRPERWLSDSFLQLDPASAANLEIFETLMGGKQKGTLFHVIDHTRTASGGRRLKTWLSYPLCSLEPILKRQSGVAELVDRLALRESVRERLGEVSDIQRLLGRLAGSGGSPKDLVALRRSLDQIPGFDADMSACESPLLVELRSALDPCDDLRALIERAIVDEPPLTLSAGGAIKRGFDADLDELIDIARGGKEWMLGYEADQRRATGVQSLKVRYNRVFGYYIEVTRANTDSVPEDYIRKQTLANAERYFTSELKEFEEKVLGAEEKRVSMEHALFEQVRQTVLESISRLRGTADRLSELDALASLAQLAARRGYVRPTLSETKGIEIVAGRHPVVETMVEAGRFVPNDFLLSSERRLAIITGPNMAGKSTAIRQVALIVLLAQVGGFVPAESATIGLVDQIFSRVGASDNLARGQSTFMVEMSETAHILTHATARSLVILDEIGRGTATWDGLSIAWAVAEYLHDELQAQTLFATHYHELTELSRQREAVFNLSVAVKEWEEEIIFLHKVISGPANRSYGIQVARLAGVPGPVVDRARDVLHTLETAAEAPALRPQTAAGPVAPPLQTDQLSLFGSAPTMPPELKALLQDIAGQSTDAMRPLEALNLLDGMVRELQRYRTFLQG